MRHRILKVVSLLLLFSTIPIALVGIDRIVCVFGNYRGPCRVFSYTRLGLVIAVVVVSLLLWGIADAGEGGAADADRPPRAPGGDSSA